MAAYKLGKERREAEGRGSSGAERRGAPDRFGCCGAAAAAERGNANIVEDARAQLATPPRRCGDLSDGLEAARAGGGGAGLSRPSGGEDATAIAIERAEASELERSLAEAVALQVARAELEESLARERDAALAGLDTAKRDHDDALARERRRQDAVRCAHDDELSELQGAAAARERRDAAHRMKLVSSARRRGASFCFMVLRRWRRARVSKAWRSWADATARRRVARERSDLYDASSTSARRRR